MMEQLSYNVEAWRILAYALIPVRRKMGPDEVSGLCREWTAQVETLAEPKDRDPREGSGIISVLQSSRRQYTVKGMLLSTYSPRSWGSAERYYLFLLERGAAEQSKLCLVFRQFKLTNREQEITRLLLADQSNKEIAAALGLSLNTVKVYMKLLTRKLGVTSRTGILARVLSEQRATIEGVRTSASSVEPRET
jgi:DNA-binding CsgD family transcriptional regulator